MKRNNWRFESLARAKIVRQEIEDQNKRREIAMKKRLQVFLDGKWQYVFCYNPQIGIIVTPRRESALDQRDLEYFQNKFGNNEFRIKGGT